MIRNIAIVLFACLAALTWAAERADFSGTWTLEENKTELEQGRRMVAKTLKVEQGQEKIIITRENQNRSGETIENTETLTMDGKVNEVTIRNRPREVKVNWSEDGKQMTVESEMTFERDGQSMKIEATEKWSMENDMLKIEATYSTRRGDRSFTLYYSK